MTIWRDDNVVDPGEVGMDAGALDKLARLFADHVEKRDFFDGAQVAVYRYGKRVLFMGGGVARVHDDAPVTDRTIFTIFSSTKGWATLAMHMLHERGKFDYSDAIASVWPGFGEGKNKDKITFAHLMSHRAGFPLGPAWLTPKKWGDRAEIQRAMEEIELKWEPGEKNGYHAVNYGFMVNELVQRLDGRDCGQFVRDEVFGPLGLTDSFLSLPPSEDDRVAYCFESPETREGMTLQMGAAPSATSGGGPAGGNSLAAQLAQRSAKGLGDMPPIMRDAVDEDALAEFMDPTKPHLMNRPEIWRLVLPFGNGIASADDLAHFYAALALGGELDGVRLLKRDTIEHALEPTNGPNEVDQVIRFPLRWGLGWMIGPLYGAGATLNTFGHGGMGGQMGFADLDRGLSYGFVNTAGKGGMLPFMMFSQQLQGFALKACAKD